MNNSQELVHAKLPRFDHRDGTVRARLQYNVHLFPVPDVKKNVSKRVQLLGSAKYGYLTILGEFGGAEFPGEELRALIPAKALLCYDCQCALKIFQTVCRIGSIAGIYQGEDQ